MEDKRLLVPLEKRLSVETLAAVLKNYDGDDFQGYTEMVMHWRESGPTTSDRR
ncbi:hypothetical protein HAX54_039923, partial [Datura stramonium]|nr:hypothetical protein [Datura stramonium]